MSIPTMLSRKSEIIISDARCSLSGVLSHRHKSRGVEPRGATYPALPAPQFRFASFSALRAKAVSTGFHALVAQRKSGGLRSPGSQVQILPRVPVFIDRVAQSAEAIDLKSIRCGCESRRGHQSSLFFPIFGAINRTSVPASPAKRSVPSPTDGMRCKSSWLRQIFEACDHGWSRSSKPYVAQSARGAGLRIRRLRVQVLP